MKISGTFHIRFSGLCVRFTLPAPAILWEEFTSFLCEDTESPDAEYEIQLLHSPLNPPAPLFYNNLGTKIYKLDEGWLRIYPLKTDEGGCQVACLLRPNGKNILYYPASMWDYYASPLHCMPQLGLELLLLQHDAFLLHSSVVKIHGKTVLFSGPPAAGKSTQADLWAKHLGARILNGDRCVVMKRPDGFYGGGCPLAGTSGIYDSDQAPIAGIFLVNQAKENSVQQLGIEAFSPLFSQTLINSWDVPFMHKITAIFESLLEKVPVYRLNCRIDEDAVHMAYQALFQEGDDKCVDFR